MGKLQRVPHLLRVLVPCKRLKPFLQGDKSKSNKREGGQMMAAFLIRTTMSLFITIIIIVFTLVTVVAIIDSKCCRPGPPTVVNYPAPRKRFRFDPKVKLNIQSIIRWEQLRGKSFSLMDYSDKDDIDSLLYTTTICNNKDNMYTLEVFRHTLSNEKITREMVMALERETAVLAQFQKSKKRMT